MNIRASIGTVNRLGLAKGRNDVEPTTAYLLLERGCSGKCVFCPQSAGVSDRVSRVIWPEFELDDIVKQMDGSGFERICLQAAIYPKLEDDLAIVLSKLSRDIPISVSISPLSKVEPFKLAEAGQYVSSVIYVLSSVLVSIMAIFLAVYLVRGVFS